MKPVVFVGPSLSHDPVLASRAFAWRPPASEGDVFRAALKQPPAIALIDGRFEDVPSVWHKEILWALSNGIAVYGAASMGALRAAELDRFGMIGIGAIYEAYRDGRYADDDEVAVVHGPKELGYAPLSIALVDIRATLVAARRVDVVSADLARHILHTAKRTFFKDRTWDVILDGTPGTRSFRRWAKENEVAQKRADALLLLKTLCNGSSTGRPKSFDFQATVFWQALAKRHTPRRTR